MTGTSDRGLSRAEYNALVAADMTEKLLQQRVTALARTLGWRTFHAWLSVRSTPGFPDLVLLHVGQQRLILRELKTQRGRITATQQEWLDDFTAAGQDAGVWRPSDLLDGSVERELRGQPTGAAR